MWRRIKDLWVHNRYLLLAFVLVIGLAGLFGVRAVTQFIYWSDPAKQDQTLAGWMTPRYVARSYDVPPEVVLAALGIEKGPPRRVSLESLAEAQGMSLAQMQARLQEAVALWRATHPEAAQ